MHTVFWEGYYSFMFMAILFDERFLCFYWKGIKKIIFYGLCQKWIDEMDAISCFVDNNIFLLRIDASIHFWQSP